MKKNILNYFSTTILLSVLLLSVVSLNAQTIDTTVYDYDSYTGCDACGDKIMITSTGTKDSLTDATLSTFFFSAMRVKVKLFTCYNGTLNMTLNGNIVGSIGSPYNCACNACDSLIFNISSTDISKYYKYGQKNVFRLVSTSSTSLYIDRTIIYRTKSKRFNYDAGVVSVDSPSVVACKGSRNIVVKIANYGKKQISSASIDWTWNGVTQTAASFSGTLDTLNGSGNNTAQVKLGSQTFKTGKIDTLVAWTKNPGGIPDSLNTNDTIKIFLKCGYSDTITVGGTSPSFSTIQGAVDALMLNGVCASVFVKIRVGTYNEQVTIGPIPNANSTNTITFLSSNNDSSSVVINYSANSSLNYTVRLNNTGFINFNKITIEALSSSYGTTVSMIGAIENVSFNNCHLIGITTTSTSSSLYNLNRSTSTDKTTNLIFNRSRISNGSYGILLNNASSNYLNGLFIQNCIFENQHYINLYFTYSKNIGIRENRFERSTTSYTSGYGIYIYGGSDSISLVNNKIFQNNGGTGIFNYNTYGTNSKRTLIGNNFIYSKSSSSATCYGIYQYDSYYTDIVNNNIFTSSGSASNNSIYGYYGANNRLLYNNMYNADKGSVFYIQSGTTTFNKSDRNNFYNSGNALGSWYGSSVNSISDLKILGNDSNSISVNPNYTSFTDLHAYATDIDGRALPYSKLGRDIDGQLRNTSTPDIGADEFNLVSIDAGISEVRQTITGSQCLKVVIKNYGTTTLTSANIDWTLNGVSKTRVNWTGSIAKGDTDIVCLGNITFKRDTLYSLKTWTSAPNSGTDSIKNNDTLKTQFYPAMNGIYTIGGSSPDFSTFSVAVTSLKNAGIIDSVYFKIRNGTYTEQIEIGNIKGANHKNSVIFESENKDSTKVILQYNSANYSKNYVVWMNGSYGTTLRKMTLQNNSSSYRTVVKISNSSRVIKLENNILQNPDSTNSGTESALIHSEYNRGNSTEILNNVLNRGSRAIYVYGDYHSKEKDILIQGNLIRNQGYWPVYLYALQNINFSNNIVSVVNNYVNTGVYWEYNTGTAIFSSNKINISGNNAYYAAYINSYSSTTDTLQIFNNFISISGNTSGTALYTFDLDLANIFYNSLLNNCTDSSNESSAFYLSYGYYKVFNNNAVHLQNGYAVYSDYLYGIESNFNNLYSSGSKFVYWNGNYYSNLSSFSASESLDSNSIETDPSYTSSADLHVSNIKLNAKAKLISGITKDIDGETRNASTPDIGADEFVPLSIDAGVSKLISPPLNFRADTLDIIVVVNNFGIDTIKNLTIQGKINKDTLTRVKITRKLASGDTAHVKIGSYIFKTDSIYNIYSWSTLPNGVNDPKKSNDTLKLLNIRPAMSGVYTIGGTSPNFATFKAAINALKLAGVADSVRFRVRQGTYTEQLIIPAISGAGGRNSIVFESQDKDTTKVLLRFASTKSDTNFVVQLKGANGITFRYLKIMSFSSSNYNVVFDIRGKAANNTLYRNYIEGSNTTYGSTSNALIFSGQDADDNFVIADNIIKNGDYGIYISGYPSSAPYLNEKGLEINNNRILNPYQTGIYCYYVDTVSISGNHLFMDKYYYSIGIELESIRKMTILKNRLQMFNAQIGFYAYNCGNSSKRSLFANNDIYLKSTSTTGYGLYFYYPNSIDFIHNSIHIDNASYSGSRTLEESNGSNNTMYNNIFANSSSGYALYLQSSTSFKKSDYNDFYSNSSNLAYFGGTIVSDLNSWKNTTKFDSNSLSVNPSFKSKSDLHVKEVSLNGAAKYFKSVPLDFDSEKRDTLKPDIGADEFTLPPNDAGISKVIIPNKPFPADSQFVKVVLKNFGGNPLYIVDLAWKFNGVSQTTYKWADTLLSGDTVHIKLAKKLFTRGTPYSIKVWTSQPNGTGDSINNNDTIEALNQYPALSGIYTIGGSSPDFSTLVDAVTAIKQGGIIDSVRFDIRSGTYYEKISIPYIYGANKENAIIFQSELKDSSKVFIVGTPTSSNNYVVRIDSANGITFRYLTLKTTLPSSYNRVFEILRACKNINIHDCHLHGVQNSTSSNESIVYLRNTNSNEPSSDNINIFNNRFENGSMGIYYNYGYSSLGTAKNLRIYRNNFENQYYYGINLSYVNDFMIKDNSIYHTSSGYSYEFGIYVQYSYAGFEISNNNIYNQNYIGIYLYDCDGTSGDTALISNNFIHTRTNNSVYGVLVYNSNYLNFVNNNIHVHSTSTSAYAAYFSSPSVVFSYNNNFVNTGAGYAIYLNGSFARSNFNNFFTGGSVLANRSGNLSNLSAWKSSTGYDAKSISTDPGYFTSSDLHVRNSDLNAVGRNHKYLIKYDIDGEKRDSITPDIGADEFKIPAANDAGISAYVGPVSPFALGNNKVKVYIKNFGSDSLKSATIKWRVNGTLQTSKNWTGKLKTGQSDTITVGTFNFASGKKHDLQFWSTVPNGASDTINYNDTLLKKDVYPALKGVYTVSGTLPDFSSLTDAFTALKIGGSSDTVWFKIRTGTYSYDLQIDAYVGATAKRPVYIEAESGDSSDVVLTNSGYSGQIIYVRGADYLRFRKLTFRPTYYNALRFDNISKGLRFNNCHFDLNTYYYYYSYGIISNSDLDDSLMVQNCRFDNGYIGISTYGYGSGSVYEKGIVLSNNIFTNQQVYAINLQYSDAAQITSNIINNSISSNYLINIYGGLNALNISYNKIIASANSGNGLIVSSYYGNSSKRCNIFNNFFAIKGASNSQNAIYLNDDVYLNFFHNSINVYGSNTGSFGLQVNAGNNYDVRNNAISNSGGGYAIAYSNSSSFTQSNYNDLFSAGTNLGKINTTNYTTLAAWKTATSKDANSLSLDPAYTSNTDLHSNLSSLDSACVPISSVTNDIDLETRNTVKADIGADEFQSLTDNLGISLIIAPVSSCSLDSTYIKLRIFNFGNKKQVNFPIRYRIDAGSVKSFTVTDTIKPGKDLEYQFANKEPLAENVTYKLIAWTDLSNEKFRQNDSLKLTFTNYHKPDSVKNMVPSDAITGMDYPVSLSWAPSSGATRYDVYVWDFGTSRPSTPILANTSQISHQIGSGLTYGNKYNWQIVARNPICNTPGNIQTFTMKFLPDLIVEQVNSPKTAFSANTISISWKVKNTGSGSASGTWYDAIYLSNDAIYDVTDIYMGAALNTSALNASQSYSQSASITLPNGISGNFYIFVVTDVYNYTVETSNNNNSTRDTGKMAVTLTPPPDLIVTNVTRPATAFSGATANVTYTIKNSGTGQTRSGGWRDRILISTEKVINSTSVDLKNLNRTSNLMVDSSYSVSTTVTIPNYISGRYYFVVETDYNKQEYEHANETNNTRGSDSIKVVLTPPPDLIIKNLYSADTASNSESVLVEYDAINDGGTTTGGGFYDVLFLCPTSTFDVNISTYFSTIYHNKVDSKDTSLVSKYVKIPKSLNGTYYLFVLTDYYNYINELSKENNNISAGFKMVINSPELIVQRVIASATDTTGSTTPVTWTVKNQGKGTDYQENRNDSIYISKSAKWNRSNSTPLGRLRYTTSLNPGDTLLRSAVVAIPDGFDGGRYFFVVTDASNQIFENGKDTNNYKRSNLMNVILAPYPDLLPTITSFPDSTDAGEIIGIGYNVKNQGLSTAKPNWNDRFYFSKDSIFNLSKVVALGTAIKTSILKVDSSYNATVYFTLPASIARGNYFYFVFSDADKKVYEHLNDSNNITRTKKIFIDGYPPVDLKVNCPTFADTVYSGNNYQLTYSVENIGEAKTAVGAWTDGIYLSSDSILGAGDVFLTSISVSKALGKDSTYYVNKTITIPNGLEGNFYLFVKSDYTKKIGDIDTNNNKKAVCKATGGSKKIRFNLTPPPDLQITSWTVPSTAVSGQPIKIKWKVENKGSGSTRSGAWKDQFYLSTDYVVDASDYQLGEHTYSGNLAVNGTYTDSQNYSIPINFSGNYIVILRTDGANVEYEHTKEGNNLVSSSTTIKKAPPADLIVSSITSPDSVLSGYSIEVTWKVKNIGSNPANGHMRDNVYLSTDNKQDGGDLLLKSEAYSISLAPNAQKTTNKSLLVSGVPLGDYYVLVTTDVLNNINELSDTNNTLISSNLLNVNVPILPIAIKKLDTLTDNEKIYYRIVVPDSLEGQSLLITLKGDSIKGNNEIYVRYNEIASGSVFDYKFREPFKGNQEIIIPSLIPGTYYLLTTGQTSGGNKQNISLLARIMPFEIRKVAPVAGGNTGEVTLLIEGSKLDSGVVFYLLDSASAAIPIDYGEPYYSGSSAIESKTVNIDPTLVYLTFDLNGKNLGDYDVVGVKDLEEARLAKGFKIVAGNEEDLSITVYRPGNMRTNNIATMSVLFSNNSNIDLVNHKILITSSAGAPIALTPEDLSKNLTTLEVVVQENGGPTGRLRPGGNGSVFIYTQASGALGFTIIK